MEATKERVGLLDKILPPTLADAGLEDCALPPDSIQEAFRKAADAVKSRAASLFEYEGEGGCVADPGPVSEGAETVIVGEENKGKSGPCLTGKGNEKLAESEKGRDALVVASEERSCGDDLKGIYVEGIESSREKKDESEEDEEEEKKRILVEGFV